MRTSEEFFEMYHKVRWEFKGNYEERRAQELKLFADWYNEMDKGEHCHIHHWSDVSPCTVIKRSKTTITVRHDKAERDPNWKPEWIPGGFSAVCTNIDEQKWIIEEDENGYVETFRWHKNANCYENTAGEKLLPGWAKYYDYNF